MNKSIFMVAMTFASLSAYAGTVTVEVQDMESKRGVSDMRAMILTVTDNITKNVSGLVTVTGVKVDSTQAVSNRIEAGLMVRSETVPGLALRVALGERYTGRTNYSTYYVNPSYAKSIGNTGFVGSVGWRFREALDSDFKNIDQTRSWRFGLAYNINKTNQIGVAYYKVDGTIEQNSVGLNYTRRF